MDKSISIDIILDLESPHEEVTVGKIEKCAVPTQEVKLGEIVNTRKLLSIHAIASIFTFFLYNIFPHSGVAWIFVSVYCIAVAAQYDIGMVEEYFTTPLDGGIISGMFFFAIAYGASFIALEIYDADVVLTHKQYWWGIWGGAFASLTIALYYGALHKFNNASFSESIFIVSTVAVPVIMYISGAKFDFDSFESQVALAVTGLAIAGNAVFVLHTCIAKKSMRTLWASIYSLMGMIALSVSLVIMGEVVPLLDSQASSKHYLEFVAIMKPVAIGSFILAGHLWMFRWARYSKRENGGKGIVSIVRSCYKATAAAEFYETFARIFLILAIATNLQEQFVNLISYMWLPGLIILVSLYLRDEVDDGNSPEEGMHAQRIHERMCLFFLVIGFPIAWFGPGTII